jgi:DNA-binding transcriptional LysR family regulator
MRSNPAVTLRCIRSFIAIADHGSFRHAADALSMSQPALSAHLRELETLLGVTLLRRTTRTLQVTERGQVFLERVRRSVAELDAAVLDMQDQAAEERGHVTVACVPSIAAGVFPRVIRTFAQDHPHTTVEVCDDRTEIIEDRVLRSQADFGIAPGPARSADLAFEAVIDDGYLALCARSHPLAQNRSVTLKQLSKYPMISMRPEQSMRRLLDDVARDRNIMLHTVHEVYHHDTLMGMVAEGLGVGAMPLLTAALQPRSDIAFIPIVEPIVCRKIGIISRRGEPLTGAALELAQTTKEILKTFATACATKFEPARGRRAPVERRR